MSDHSQFMSRECPSLESSILEFTGAALVALVPFSLREDDHSLLYLKKSTDEAIPPELMVTSSR